MNVYDFDGTIFSSDCSIGFCLWCMNRHPKLWFTFAPKAIKNLILKNRGKIPEYRMQREFFGYLTLIDDFDKQIKRYRDKTVTAVRLKIPTPRGCSSTSGSKAPTGSFDPADALCAVICIYRSPALPGAAYCRAPGKIELICDFFR